MTCHLSLAQRFLRAPTAPFQVSDEVGMWWGQLRFIGCRANWGVLSAHLILGVVNGVALAPELTITTLVTYSLF